MTGSEAPTGILEQLGLTPRTIERLDRTQYRPLLSFLSDWGYAEGLRACAEALAVANPRIIVSCLDRQAEAALLAGDGERAVAVMRQRLEHKDSFTARALLARALLAAGDVEEAPRIAEGMVDEEPTSVVALLSAADVRLAMGNKEGALAACRTVGMAGPSHRGYLAAMLRLYQAGGDWVSASAYAVRLLETADEERPLAAPDLRLLRDYFRASGEANRAADMEAELGRRYEADLATLRQLLGDAAGPARTRAPRVERETAPEPPAEPLASFESVPVSQEELGSISAAAERLFGFTDLLPGQAQIIACVLRGEDVLAILPTGGGKSFCYQLPAFMAESGLTLVVSPLIALMKDQIEGLPGPLRPAATAINSSLEGDELRRRLESLRDGGYRLVYAAPERLRQPPFVQALRRAGVSRLVIDEAHCISAWGHDFRPDYLAIQQVRQALGRPQLLALTATAPETVRRDIVQHLGAMRVIAGDVTRPNLRLEVCHCRDADEKLGRLIALCRAEPGSGIVYVGSRARAEELAALLRGQGVSAGYYHAGMEDRARAQDDFMSGRVRVVVATVAFGMGIDKPDVRFVLHFDPPGSVENYYQEAGRAGRDGLPARCTMLFASGDRGTLTRRAREDLLTVEFLRSVYAAVRRRLAGAATGRVALGDLERDLASEEARIAISFLEKAGLLRRGPDLPRAATVRLLDGDGIEGPGHFAAFCRAARLWPGRPMVLDLFAVARQADLLPDDIEAWLLEWADEGRLSYHPSGRDLLLELLPPPANGSEEVALLLERHAAIQEQRVSEIVAYARTTRCRHGHLNAYLGGRPIRGCRACDNCLGPLPEGEDALPPEEEQYEVVLRCLAQSRGWGPRNLVRILRGERDAPPAGQASPHFGALAFRSESAVSAMLRRLLDGELLEERRLEHGGALVDITARGRQALTHRGILERLVDARVPGGRGGDAKRPARGAAADETTPADEALVAALRDWRRDQAKGEGIAAYMVLHDTHLRAIAAGCPGTLTELAQVKGIGPRKLEKYGEALLQLVRRHGAPSARQATLIGDLE